MRENKKKIVIAGHDLKFAKGIISILEKDEKFIIKTDKWRGHNVHDEAYSRECLNWADIVICEWGLGNAVWYSNHKLPHQKLIVRMHAQELKTIYPKQFRIENINKIIAISPYIYEEFYRVFKFPREKMLMIYNSIDTKVMNREKKDSDFNLGFIGMCPKLKRLDLAIDIFEKLWTLDKRYKLYIKGKHPQEYPWLWNNENEREFFENVFKRISEAEWGYSVIFDGFGNDIPEWLQKINFVLSTSDSESFHLAPGEGMASGAFPIILNWDGSNTIYPSEYIHQNVNDCVKKILEINSKNEKQDLREKIVNYTKENFDVNKIAAQLKNLLENL
ncbi:glycosyltransferase family 4 protein [Bacillus haynesii]|uniref:glycosyltransferase family 4 protein n=1 Tax=Bacillus haynesii TaxID=1925021 RepID=UPI00227F8E16|nr:glycosyltransferase family 4 protein [Bacillus haynesii]MCY8215198.1 glycosyltransferase family 4 protein [Bacillus haynesii]MCY8608417.1 glycosyltransferase family 4 protein [Bacillus haynesii]